MMILLHKGFNYSQDGPGNRLVYHLQGCNFRCKWCSNPESMTAALTDKDVGTVSPAEIIEEAVSCRMMFFDGGGVTFTGGEPTLWHTELLEALRGLKQNGIGTAIETNGSDARLHELLPYVDTLMIDLKHPSREEHIRWTGADNRTTLENIGTILDSGRQILIRIPLIHGVNVCPDTYCAFFAGHDMRNAAIEILPYHEYGKGKWTLPYEIENGYVTQQEIDCMRDAFRSSGYRMIST